MTDVERRGIRRALVSVSDKRGIAEFAAGLAQRGVSLVATGSTAALIEGAGVAVQRVEELTGFPEVLDGRVKTLHPKVHAGVLADTRLAAHLEQLEQLGIEPFDLVVVNLYPFSATVASGAGFEECVEQIDIGGPSMVRAAAKNHPSVAVVVDPGLYDEVLAAVDAGGFDLARRRQLAQLAFQHTAEYDSAIANWFSAQESGDEPPAWASLTLRRADVLRYGENPHQRAALYVNATARSGLAQAEQLHGKQMSYNNFTDAEAALRAAGEHEGPAVAIIKHANPCGIAVGETVAEAHRKAHACDPVSAFGGVIAVNREVDEALAGQIAEIFTEVVVATGFAPAAREILSRKPSIRLIVVPEVPRPGWQLRPIPGGALLQQYDDLGAPGDSPSAWRLAAGEPAVAATLADLAFAWRACRSVKSNAIVLARDLATVGVGMGQVNRVDSARLAVARAGERSRGAVGASDAFFPFPDGLEVLAEAGAKAIVAPGGSVRDGEVIEAAEKAGVTLYLTDVRHFSH
ncbi:bifunctional phosphoribosylaminoimidazolecarboxamide formyltransferase/IMP cyclohydrolase [Segniliparus rugosus]|uniref:Bifunctional purine biosynthesis protein PurH n=1 Tax=Segniliparus rugosus (strain ATCC BAA-974 / DSM 45345 / CCUG 50838 / CIP 108380 / JCM 13579 / CDC 945) TaxID=679197 RepID=E5XTF1_SEGRC|nr:bifunctional phosphoribosylaminoimidazolecarboxamide formyltransferase/IMP cyclohydrolase [Segniliparus rugosus]EFV12363.1 phosphoribosylaminoimidazolecarboxamide formyltransferase/IMP cyclohydrolase [Segniliparus rugosus ATCC BAA-974]